MNEHVRSIVCFLVGLAVGAALVFLGTTATADSSLVALLANANNEKFQITQAAQQWQQRAQRAEQQLAQVQDQDSEQE